MGMDSLVGHKSKFLSGVKVLLSTILKSLFRIELPKQKRAVVYILMSKRLDGKGFRNRYLFNDELY